MSIYFEWNENMSVGEPNIDKQHQKLLSQVNKILDSVIYGSNSVEMKEAVQFFDDYIKEHLSYEEEYMKEIGYPEIETHKKMHLGFIEKYKKLKEELESGVGSEVLIPDIETYLGKWWVDHIGVQDKKYHTFLDENR